MICITVVQMTAVEVFLKKDFGKISLLLIEIKISQNLLPIFWEIPNPLGIF